MSYWESDGASDEWYTPAYIFDALECGFDCDVAAPLDGPLHVPCDSWVYDGSLMMKWGGFVWMNPPFGGRNGLMPWLRKFIEHGNGIALTPDRTSAPWWQQMAKNCDAVLFINGKVKFIRPDGSVGKSPSNGTTLFAIGPAGVKALRTAARNGLGFLAEPINATAQLKEAA